MTAIGRMAMLDLRTIAPYRWPGLAMFALVILIDIRSPASGLPALMLLAIVAVTPHPFSVADKAGLDILYGVLPLSRRAVVYGRYAWALASFLATAAIGIALEFGLATVQSLPFDASALFTVLTLCWAMFTINVAIQFPLLIRFGYSQMGVLATAMPLALIGVAIARLHLTVPDSQIWRPALWVLGAVAFVASAVMSARWRPAPGSA